MILVDEAKKILTCIFISLSIQNLLIYQPTFTFFVFNKFVYNTNKLIQTSNNLRKQNKNFSNPNIDFYTILSIQSSEIIKLHLFSSFP